MGKTMTRMVKIIKTYTELSKLKTFKERYEYLKLDNAVGEETFGFDRYLNQRFYKSYKWKQVRNQVIVRDHGCDLGVLGHDIYDEKILIHHMNPISKDDIIESSKFLLNPEYLICVSQKTHNALHYGVNEIPDNTPVERTKNDTCPWRH